MTYRLHCQYCGKSFESSRSDAKTCGATCRGRLAAKTKRLAAVPDVSVEESEPEQDAKQQHPSSGLFNDGVLEMVEQVLREAERYNTPAGRVACRIARRLDYASFGETGSGIAALSKELDRVLEKALAGVEVEADELDELKKRRLAKAAQA